MSEANPVQNATAEQGRNARKERVGVVKSAAADKTIVVAVDKRRTHDLYGKTLKKSKTYHVHDERNEAGAGDRVRIIETRPMSKTKRWRLLEIIEQAK